MQYREFRAMNTKITLGAEGGSAEQALAIAQALIEKSEQRFTRFSAESELSNLNQLAGEWFCASREMMEIIITALDCYHTTNHLFNPAVLPSLRAAGYTRSMDLIRAEGISSQINQTAAAPRFDQIQINREENQIRIPKEMQIDLGGIAKGWIAEKAAHMMANFCDTCAVNAGGDLFLIGTPRGQDAWEIGLEDPRNPTQDIMPLLVSDGAVATSSVVKRSWEQNGIQRHHIIDPRSGESAQTPWLTVTAFARSGARAEAFAKALLIAAPKEAETLLAHNADISFLAIDTQGQIWNSPVQKDFFYERN